MAEKSNHFTRNDIIGSCHVRDGQITNLYRRCPHCGMVDYRYSAQGLKHSHFLTTTVGSLHKYECGACRKQFYAFEVCVPAGEDPKVFYQKICDLFNVQP